MSRFLAGFVLGALTGFVWWLIYALSLRDRDDEEVRIAMSPPDWNGHADITVLPGSRATETWGVFEDGWARVERG